MSLDLPSFDSLSSTLPSSLSSLLSSFGEAFTQNARLIRLRFADDSGIAPDLLLPHRLSGVEAISSCYRYELECLSVDMHIELKDLLGQPVEIRLLLADGDERVMAGIVTQAKQLGGDGGFARYGLLVEPALATLSHRMNSRVFQDKSVPQIVAAVLEEHIAANTVFARSFAVDDQLSRDYPTRSYCLQYRESDFAFIARLLAEEGISYRFMMKRRNTPWCCSTMRTGSMTTCNRSSASIAPTARSRKTRSPHGKARVRSYKLPPHCSPGITSRFPRSLRKQQAASTTASRVRRWQAV
jgi:uncharacterized protein involved in type VI secretion and phage assembly